MNKYIYIYTHDCANLLLICFLGFRKGLLHFHTDCNFFWVVDCMHGAMPSMVASFAALRIARLTAQDHAHSSGFASAAV